ncbi:hypothetical protein RJT34_24703 [Clitoria ternatea]|uniref:Uncharacterized protein n=1 Tax=Clitoria ternatea TaxID=43366 RepID=A0AAN9FND4_CLITE
MKEEPHLPVPITFSFSPFITPSIPFKPSSLSSLSFQKPLSSHFFLCNTYLAFLVFTFEFQHSKTPFSPSGFQLSS